MYIGCRFQAEERLFIKSFFQADLAGEGVNFQEMMNAADVAFIIGNHGFAK